MIKPKQTSTIKIVFIFLIFSICLNLFFLFTWLNTGSLKTYSTKQSLCNAFAKNYLKTVQQTDGIEDFGGEKWQTAIAIESDMYNMCLLDLNLENVKQFRLTNIERL